MLAEGDTTFLSFSTKIKPGLYNQVGLAMYELPNLVLAVILMVSQPRRTAVIV